LILANLSEDKIITAKDRYFSGFLLGLICIVVSIFPLSWSMNRPLFYTLIGKNDDYVFIKLLKLYISSENSFLKSLYGFSVDFIEKYSFYKLIFTIFSVTLLIFLIIKCIDIYFKKRIKTNSLIANKKKKKLREKAYKKNKIYIGSRINKFELKDRRNAGKHIFLSQDQRQAHTLATGTTGAGKTESIIIPHALGDIQNGNGVIIIDPKGSEKTFKKLYYYAKESNKRIHFINLAKPEESSTYNPVLRGTPNQLMNRVVGAFDWGEGEATYYKDRTIKLLTLLLEAINDINELITFTDLYNLFDNKDLLEEIFERIQDDSIKYRFKKDLIDNYKNISRDLEGFLSKIYPFAFDPFNKICNTYNSDVNLSEIYEQNDILYVTLPSNLAGESSKSFGKMLLQDLKSLTGEIEAEKLKAHFFPVYIDEFSNLANADFIDWLNKARSAKIAITLATQSLADLSAYSNEVKDQIIENTNLKFFMKANSAKTIDEIMHLTGTEKESKITRQIENNTFSKEQSRMGTERIVDSFLFDPNILRKNLSTGEALMEIKNPSYSIDFIKCDYYKDTSKDVNYTLSRNISTECKGLNTEELLYNSHIYDDTQDDDDFENPINSL